ncbi:MAG TPA: serine/threonine-protein kinase, partial [Pirellulaceae bacterium]
MKVPRSDVLADRQRSERFFAEARVAARLDHPNIVSVHDAGQVGPLGFIAYAYCPGLTLAEWLHRRPEARTFHDAAKLVCALSRAVQYAHEQGVLHRDLKPANVILQQGIGEGVAEEGDSKREGSYSSAFGLWLASPGDSVPLRIVPKITDFGLAKLLDQNSGMTQTGAIVGTPSYMSPEQAGSDSDRLGPATDVYGLGAILYELISGRPPFRADTPLETLRQVTTVDPISLYRLREKLPRDLGTICEKCLRKEPHLRYGRAGDLTEDLQRFLRHEPVLARPVGFSTRASRWCRRHPMVASLVLTLIVLGVVSLSTILWNLRQLRVALTRLNQARQTETAMRERAEATVYYQSVALAHHQWRANRIRQAERTLADADPARRGWEWKYVQRLCHSHLSALQGHRQDTQDIQYSPDGKWLASAGGTWGTTVPGEIHLWDVETGRCVWNRTVSAGPIFKLAFAPDSSWFATSSSWTPQPPAVSVWNAHDGENLAELPMGSAFAVAVSPDGKLLAAASSSGAIHVFDTLTWELRHELSGHTDNVFGLEFHPDSRRLVSGSRDRTVRVWDAVKGKPLLPALWADSDVRAISISPDGKRVVTGDWNANAQIWDMETGQRQLKYVGHSEPILAVEFSPDGHYVASGGTDREIRIWSSVTGKDANLVRGHDGPIRGLAFRWDGSRLASAGCHNEVREWDATSHSESEAQPVTMARPLDACFHPVTG